MRKFATARANARKEKMANGSEQPPPPSRALPASIYRTRKIRYTIDAVIKSGLGCHRKRL